MTPRSVLSRAGMSQTVLSVLDGAYTAGKNSQLITTNICVTANIVRVEFVPGL